MPGWARYGLGVEGSRLVVRGRAADRTRRLNTFTGTRTVGARVIRR